LNYSVTHKNAIKAHPSGSLKNGSFPLSLGSAANEPPQWDQDLEPTESNLVATDASLSPDGKQGIAYASLFVFSATVPVKGNSSTNIELQAIAFAHKQGRQVRQRQRCITPLD